MNTFSNLENRELVEEIAEEIRQTGEVVLKYGECLEDKSSDYRNGWNNAIGQFLLALLGRKEQDGAQLIIQSIQNMPSTSQHIHCSFCEEFAVEVTLGGDPVCESCGEEIPQNYSEEKKE